MAFLIDKIKINAEIEINYSVLREDGGIDFQGIKSDDVPRPELYRARDELELDFTVFFSCESFTLTELTIFRKDGLEYAAVKGEAEYHHTHGACKVQTPKKVFDAGVVSSETATAFSSEIARHIELLLDEAGLFIKGERAQGNLFNFEKREAAEG